MPPAEAGADARPDRRLATEDSGDARPDRRATGDARADVTSSEDAGRDATHDAPRDVLTTHDAPRDVMDARVADAGQDAAPAVCTASTCTVVTMASKLYDPIAVAVDDTYLYWLEFGSPTYDGYGELVQILKSAPCLKRSCYGVLDPMVLPQQTANSAAMGLGSGAVCYTQSFDVPASHSVDCVPFVAGAQEVDLDQSTGNVGDVWVGDAGAVWAVAGSSSTSTDGTIRTATFTGAATTVVSGRAQPWAVASDGQTIYWTELGVAAGTGAVYASVGDGGARPLATSQSTPQAMALYDGYVYWANSGDGSVWRASTTSSTTSPESVATGLPVPVAVVVDGTGVYVACAGMGPSYLDGSVVQIAAPGATPITMLADENNLGGIAIDETYLYAAVAGSQGSAGVILRIPKVVP
jgi:hypothetical protein